VAVQTSAVPRISAPKFYLGMALVFATVAFAGFTPTYLAPVATGTLSGTPILHLHGLVARRGVVTACS
jgi:hypothetical protein